ncbi:DHS-like NAD/FAD-binding domain-containing protein [Kickxella alabastrina]|uniref:DHS-like NAD/FAD-binding domain-containing protein n=1 Tax=Kickxella alabastrina TaxID=61397 RepID=UPI00221FA672|nr:DHS-like NAD/FAD-binding domain-containing protein [Kickxella alabastrina]KAI7826362.1 DHS-like NAD/FAD-binding domain-containing protein [Kickxella alabastrina]
MPPFAKVRIQGLYALPKSQEPVTAELLESVAEFFRRHSGRVLAITGAGVSVASGIPDYRGPQGTYRVHRGYTPILHHELIAQHATRQRYWARSFFGIRPAFLASPNPTHRALASLENAGHISGLITQNVDGLHLQAGSRNVLELHGSLRHVRCLDCGHLENREDFQRTLEELNPVWAGVGREMLRSGEEPMRRPDGDIELPAALSYADFAYPQCPQCHTGHFMPTVVFFGGNVAPEVRLRSHEMVEENGAVIVCGSSLATFSAFRLVRHAREMGREVLIVNLGETRGDKEAKWKVEAPVEEIVPPVAAILGA